MRMAASTMRSIITKEPNKNYSFCWDEAAQGIRPGDGTPRAASRYLPLDAARSSALDEVVDFVGREAAEIAHDGGASSTTPTANSARPGVSADCADRKSNPGEAIAAPTRSTMW